MRSFLLNLAQAPEKRVAVAGDAHVSFLTGQRGAGDVPQCAAQSIFAYALPNRRRELQARNRKAAE